MVSFWSQAFIKLFCLLVILKDLETRDMKYDPVKTSEQISKMIIYIFLAQNDSK